MTKKNNLTLWVNPKNTEKELTKITKQISASLKYQSTKTPQQLINEI